MAINVGRQPIGVGAYTGADQPTTQVNDGWTPPPEDKPPTSPLPKPRPGRNLIILIIVALVLMVVIPAVVIVEVATPSPHPFFVQIDSSRSDDASANLTPPFNSQVVGSWHTLSGDNVTFWIRSSGYQQVIFETAASGSFSFTADVPPHGILVSGPTPEVTDVSGDYWYANL